MSTISAGTTNSTALVETGDTTGNLIIKANTSTTVGTFSSTGLAVVGSLTSTTPAAGAFTTLSASSTVSAAGSTTIDSSGNLGVGTTTPTTKLTIGTGAYSAAASGTTGMYTTATGLEVLSDSYFFGNRTGSTRMVIDSAGGVKTINTIGVGNTAPSTSGAGITFPATQSASTDVNTLDDYEEGTWTPGISFNNASVGATYGASNAGNYVKIGKMVTVTGFLQLTNKGSSTGTSRITGLPFTPGGSGESGDFNCPIGYTGAITFSGQLGFYGSAGAAALFPLSTTSGGTSANLTDTAFGNSSVAVVSCTYFV